MGYNKDLFTITDGPSRDLLWTHTQFHYDKGVSIPLTFTVEQNGNAVKFSDVKVNSIAHEDGSGNSFLIKGYFQIRSADGTVRNAGYEGCYNTKGRSGYIRITQYSPCITTNKNN